SNEGDIVLDNFMGVGSTGEASLRLGRQFIGFEIDNNYFNQASKRLYRVEKEVAHEFCSSAEILDQRSVNLEFSF
ncbi:MAG: DNA methyltransferase, partial [Bdellovibrionaceae bacterium]|nr:DNA methyltransferase [Pseudobdellovibrionaceae bacterium]